MKIISTCLLSKYFSEHLRSLLSVRKGLFTNSMGHFNFFVCVCACVQSDREREKNRDLNERIMYEVSPCLALRMGLEEKKKRYCVVTILI